jgi:predicted phage terminase large subunit-like protein
MADHDDSYEIGYRKPPAETRFTKGQSGNPKGRPKGTKNLATLLIKVAQERVRVTISRLNSKQNGVIIIVMQRLHQDDLVGHVLEQEGWEVVSFPAIAEEEEMHIIDGPYGRRFFRRKPGDVLQPQRESKLTLENLRKTIGEYDFSSQYQQRPMPLGGAIIKTQWLTYYDPGKLPERFTMVLQSWDTANKSGDLNDFSVCTTWGVYDRHYYLLNVFRKRLNYPDLKRAVKDQAREQSHRGTDKILIEDKASGTQLIQDLRAEGVFNIEPYAPPPGSDKLLRLYAQSAEFENGRVLLPRSASWLDEYVRELTAFPGSKFDDQVDSTSQALEHLKKNGSLIVWEILGRS